MIKAISATFILFGIVLVVLFMWLNIPFEGYGFKGYMTIMAIAYIIREWKEKP